MEILKRFNAILTKSEGHRDRYLSAGVDPERILIVGELKFDQWVEGKIVAGDREPEPDKTMLRALARAHAWTSALRMGKPLSELAAKTANPSPTFAPEPSSPSSRPRSRKQS